MTGKLWEWPKMSLRYGKGNVTCRKAVVGGKYSCFLFVLITFILFDKLVAHLLILCSHTVTNSSPHCISIVWELRARESWAEHGKVQFPAYREGWRSRPVCLMHLGLASRPLSLFSSHMLNLSTFSFNLFLILCFLIYFGEIIFTITYSCLFLDMSYSFTINI